MNETRTIKAIGDIVEDEETAEMVSRMERAADAEISGRTVTLRWGKRQIDVVKMAASLMGVPYQTYLKQVVYRQALADINQDRAALGHSLSGGQGKSSLALEMYLGEITSWIGQQIPTLDGSAVTEAGAKPLALEAGAIAPLYGVSVNQIEGRAINAGA